MSRDTTNTESHPSTSGTSIEDAALDPTSLALLALQIQTARAVQQQEDQERSRKFVPRRGIEWFDLHHGEKAVPTRLQSEVPYPLLYTSESHNWSMVQHLLRSRMFDHPTFTYSPKRADISNKPLPPPPKHVLDLGCGTYASWIVEMSQLAGWEQTRFVGLDIAPVLLPIRKPLRRNLSFHNSFPFFGGLAFRVDFISTDHLPSQQAQRMSFVQANFLNTLPFEDGTFDYVRIADIALGVPEDQWAQVIDEARRVAGQGLIEISSLSIAREAASAASVHVPENEPEDMLKSVKMRELAHVTEAEACLFERRLISVYPLSHIPFALVLGSRLVDKTGTLPLPFHFQHADNDAEFGVHDNRSQRSNSDPTNRRWTSPLDETAGRVALAAHTAHRYSLKERLYEDFSALKPDRALSWKDHTDIFTSFKSQRTRQAGLADLLGSKLNWCTYISAYMYIYI